MEVNLKIASVASETGPLLRGYLEERGIGINRLSPITVCYGVPSNQLRTLNGNCGGGDKIRRLNQMKAGGVRTVPWFEENNIPDGFKFPALARKMAGHGGEDIVSVFQKEEVPWRVLAGWNWFSSYVPIESEYRVWVFRGKHLDTYIKEMKRPNDFKKIGRNYGNGFDFTPCLFQEDAFKEASKAVNAVKFDFGAVDLVRGLDGKIYILEINSAPGAIKSHAEVTVGKLADYVADWVNHDQPVNPFWGGGC